MDEFHLRRMHLCLHGNAECGQSMRTISLPQTSRDIFPTISLWFLFSMKNTPGFFLLDCITLDLHAKIWLVFCTFRHCIYLKICCKKWNDCTLIQECYYRTWITCVEFRCNYKQIDQNAHEHKNKKRIQPSFVLKKKIVCVIAWKTLCKWAVTTFHANKWLVFRARWRKLKPGYEK